MTNIVPISDLKNYTEVLSHCDNGSTVYLTKNGRGKYVMSTDQPKKHCDTRQSRQSVL